MGRYADQIAELELVRQIDRNVGVDGISRSDAQKLSALVMEVADTAGPLLSRIPVVFKQYTEHDLGHSRNLIDLMGRFIPPDTLRNLNALELSLLVIAALLHDIGMFVTDAEKSDVLLSDAFRAFVAASPERFRVLEASSLLPNPRQAIEDAALAEFFRKRHPERAKAIIQSLFAERLVFADVELAPLVGDICESHGWPVYTSDDPRQPERAIAKSLKRMQPVGGLPFNPQYTACCLRLADILDFDRSRTPLALLRTITDEVSQREWLKHLQITGWSIRAHEIEFYAACQHPAHYVAIMEFLELVDHELRDCRRLIMREAPAEISAKYAFHLPPAVERMYVEMADKSFAAGGFRFRLDYERIFKLLMDRSLYPDASLFLRELLQNSLDACRVRRAMIEAEGAAQYYTPCIVISVGARTSSGTILSFQDNGIGMSEDIVRNYFVQIGRSYYRSGEFNAVRHLLADAGIEIEATSQFGIGFLSCFMVADHIEIETFRVGEVPLRVTIEGPTKYFLVRRLAAPPPPQIAAVAKTLDEDGPPKFVGTRVTIRMRPDVDIDVQALLGRFAANVECDVIIKEKNRRVVQQAWMWERLAVLPSALPTSVGRSAYGDLVPEPQAVPWAPKFDDVLMAIDVPLDDTQLPGRLRGKAWFWFIRGHDGGPTPSRGFLRIGADIRPEGLPKIASSFIDTIAKYLDDYIEQDKLDLTEISRLIGSGAGATLAEWWEQRKPEQRRALLAWYIHPIKRDTKWFQSGDALRALLSRDDAWLKHPVSYTDGVGNTFPQSIALHGVEVTAGITRWDAMVGFARRLPILKFMAGFRVDVRRDAPTPAANRLFFDPQEGAKIAVPLLNAYLRRAQHLVETHPDDADWAVWYSSFIDATERSAYASQLTYRTA